MNEINALTLTNDNLVAFFFPCMANETISGFHRVAFSLCTKVWRNEAKQSTLQNGSYRKGALRFSFCCFHITRTHLFEAAHKQISVNALTLTNDNLVVFFFLGMASLFQEFAL